MKTYEDFYTSFAAFLSNLSRDIYEQPPDSGHTNYARAAIEWAYEEFGFTPSSVLDIGCGQGFAKEIFSGFGDNWTGITIGEDYRKCKEKGLNVFEYDMTFLPPNWTKKFEIVFARHVLEHSPFPILTLMEWKRVCSGFLILVHPAPEFWGVGGKNHYSVFDQERLWYTLTRAGWWPVAEKVLKTTDQLFLDNYRPEVTDVEERKSIRYPGAPKPVEYWYICKQGRERIE